MKEFIERMREAYIYDYAWSNEPLFFKVFMFVSILIGFILKVIYCVVVAVTIPLWIVPYIIYFTRRSRK